jgi:hypothetical protein
MRCYRRRRPWAQVVYRSGLGGSKPGGAPGLTAIEFDFGKTVRRILLLLLILILISSVRAGSALTAIVVEARALGVGMRDGWGIESRCPIRASDGGSQTKVKAVGGC